MLAAVNKEALKKEKEFLSADKTLRELVADRYLGSELRAWPGVLQKMLTDSAVPKAKDEYSLCVSSFGAILW